LAKEQRRIRSEYEERLRELERERHGVEEDRAQARCRFCPFFQPLTLRRKPQALRCPMLDE